MWGKEWIKLWENHEWFEINVSKNFWNVSKFYAAQFSEYIDKILDWRNIEDLAINKLNLKENSLLVTLFNKINALLPELLWIVNQWQSCNSTLKAIREKYNIEKLDIFNNIKNILNDILILSIWLKPEWVDENFEELFNSIEQKSANKMSFNDLIDFVTIIDTTILKAIANHIDWTKYIYWNREKAWDLIDIMTLERKRIIEHYLYKYNINNSDKAKILRKLLNEENIDIENENINVDKYIKYIIWYRSVELKNMF